MHRVGISAPDIASADESNLPAPESFRSQWPVLNLRSFPRQTTPSCGAMQGRGRWATGGLGQVSPPQIVNGRGAASLHSGSILICEWPISASTLIHRPECPSKTASVRGI